MNILLKQWQRLKPIDSINIGVLFLSAMILVAPANIGWRDMLKNVEDVTKSVKSVLNQRYKEKGAET